jgi:hypothetical protein
MVKFNSTIFRTIKDEATGANQSIGLFGKSFSELKNIFSSVKTNGLFKTSVVSDSDIECIKVYNDAIAKNIPHQQAMEQASKGASAATAQMIKNANGNTIALNKMTIGAKAASVAMKGLTMAGNIALGMVISWGITKAIEGISKVINHEKEAIEKNNKARKDLVQQLEEQIRTKEEEISTLEEEIDSLNNLQNKLDEVKNNKKGFLALEKEIYEQTGYNIDRLNSTADAYKAVTLEIQAQITENEKLLASQRKIATQQKRTKLEENTITNEGGEDRAYEEYLNSKLILPNGETITFRDKVNEVITDYAKKGKDVGQATVIAEAIREVENTFRDNSGTVGYDYRTYVKEMIDSEKKINPNLSSVDTNAYMENIISSLEANNQELTPENIYKEWLYQLYKNEVQISDSVDLEKFFNKNYTTDEKEKENIQNELDKYKY